jgi:hypothetical protein
VAALAIDDTALYVAENCRTGDDPFTFDVEFTLMRLDPETGATTDLVIAPFAQGVAVVAHDSKVYFGMGTTGQTFVRAISRDGPLEGPADTFRPYAVLDFPYGTALPLVVSGAEVLVVDRVDSAVLALGATPADAPTSRYVHDRTIASLVDAGGSLYLTDSHLVGTQLATRAFRVDGGTSSILYDDTQLQHVVGDERGVYAAGDLEVEPRVWGRFYELVGADGGGVATPVLRAAGITRVSALALDATHVYVVHNFSRIESAIDLVAVSR